MSETASMLDLLGDSPCLIVEPSPLFSASLLAALGDLGLPSNQIILSRRFADARKVIEQKKPKLILTEYDLPPGLGLSLIEMQEALHDERSRVSIIVTKNSTDSAVAEAAEGPVDAFLLKPFSTDVFRQRLAEVFQRKTNPSAYQRRLIEGRRRFLVKEFDEAVQECEAAKGLDEKPTMAYFLAGASRQGQGSLDQALREYREGRRLQPLHYRCLIGEFETLMAMENYREAYAVVPLIRDNYPLTSQRLGQIFTAAVFSYRFEDLPAYFELFLQTDNRTPWLNKLVSLAMFTAGKFWLQKKDFTRAVEAFESGITVKGRDLELMGMIVDECLAAAAYAEADAFAGKLLPADLNSPAGQRLRFKVDLRLQAPETMVDRGRRLVLAGHADADTYLQLIPLLLKTGRTTLAETIAHRASTEFPALKGKFYAFFQV